jgi:hypothetical protein
MFVTGQFNWIAERFISFYPIGPMVNVHYLFYHIRCDSQVKFY